MSLRPPLDKPRPASNISARSGIQRIFDLDDLTLGQLAPGQDHIVNIPGIAYIQAFESPVAVLDLGPGTPYASGHALSATASEAARVGVSFEQLFTTIRFAYTWGAAAFQETVFEIYDHNEILVEHTYFKKTGPAQWVEYTAAEGITLRAFSVYLPRFGAVDNISLY